MKIEVMYSRDTSLSVPKNNPVFRTRSRKVPGQKSRQLTFREFADNILKGIRLIPFGETTQVRKIGIRLTNI